MTHWPRACSSPPIPASRSAPSRRWPPSWPPPGIVTGYARPWRDSPRVCSWMTWTRPWPLPTPGRRSTWRFRSKTPAPWQPASATPAPCSWVPTHPSSWVTTSPGPITCCPPAAPPGTPAGCRYCRSCAASTWWSAANPPWPGWQRTSTRSAQPRTCPHTPPPSGSASPAVSMITDGPPRMVREIVRDHRRPRCRSGRIWPAGWPMGHRSWSQVWAANGSNETIQQVLQAFGGPGRTAIGFEPSYAMHPLIARAAATGWISGARDGDFGLDAVRAVQAIHHHRPDLVFLASPNKPTGGALPLAVIEAVCDAAPGMVVVDEAYAEFARDGTPSALALLPRYSRLVVTRTMSKAFALAGARLGYLAADPAVIEALLLVRLPYHLSAVTQAVARAALAHAAEPLATVQALRAERDRLVDWLRGQGLAVADSDANFVLFGQFGDAHAIWQALLERGVLIRETGPPGWLRVTAGTPAEMDAFRDALPPVLAGAREEARP